MRSSTLKGRSHLFATQWIMISLTAFSGFISRGELEPMGGTGLDGDGTSYAGEDSDDDFENLFDC